MNRFLLICLVFWLVNTNVLAQQTLSTKSKKAAELYYEADNYRVRGQYSQAIQLLEQAIEKDKKFHEAYFRLGVLIKAQGNLDQAEALLLMVIELNDGNNGASYFELAELYLKQNKYEKAIEYIDNYLAYNPSHRQRVDEANRIKANAEFSIEHAAEIREFNPKPLSDTVNMFPLQYFPIITVDQIGIIFTRRLGFSMDFDEDLVISTKDEKGNWTAPVSISDNINSEFNEGTCTMSADGRTLIFTSCYGRQGFGSCDLYISEKIGDEWTSPVNMGANVNSSAWDSQPSLSADGRQLYFISNRGGGVGGRDIWLSTKNDKDVWSKPLNLGRGINTVNEEVSPFIHVNGKTLYYATNGLPGFGGFDIYYVQLEDDKWGKPENLGPPINTGEDQVSLFITADGTKGYYSNEDNQDPNKKGKIYEFNVPDRQKIKYRSSYIHGNVYDDQTKEPIKAQIELFDLANEKRISLVNSDSITGKYLMVLTEGSNYALYVQGKGYLFKSYNFEYKMGENNEALKIDIWLTPLAKDAVTNLNNIFFDTNKYDLKANSTTELKKVIDFLKKNQKVIIEIGGHTDNVGTDAFNVELSQKRAQTVVQYLKDAGIDVRRIKAKGYGSSKPITDNLTEANRQLNRRIEFKIVEF